MIVLFSYRSFTFNELLIKPPKGWGVSSKGVHTFHPPPLKSMRSLPVQLYYIIFALRNLYLTAETCCFIDFLMQRLLCK